MRIFSFFLLVLVIVFDSCKIEPSLESEVTNLKSSILANDSDFITSFQLSQDLVDLCYSKSGDLTEGELMQIFEKINTTSDANKVAAIEKELGLIDSELQKKVIQLNKISLRLKSKYPELSDMNSNRNIEDVVKKSVDLLDWKAKNVQYVIDKGACEIADKNCRTDGAVKNSIAILGCAFSGPFFAGCIGLAALSAAYDLAVCARNYQGCIGKSE